MLEMAEQSAIKISFVRPSNFFFDAFEQITAIVASIFR
jgi:hypothetical protein